MRLMESIVLPPRRLGLIILSAFWGGSLLFALWLLAAPAHQTEMAVILTCLLCGLILLPLSACLTAICVKSLSLPTLLTLDRRGLTDHRLSADPIAWKDLTWRAVKSAKANQTVMISPKHPIRPYWPYLPLAALYRGLRLPPYPVLAMGTGKTGTEIATAIRRFRAPG